MGFTKKELLSAAMALLPPGFRFHPTDEEVVVNYLAGGSQEFIVIPEIDICKFEPEELPNQFKENSMVRSNDPEGWFLCKQEHGQKARRSTREGYWKITGNPSDVKSRDTNHRVIGSKKFLTFYIRVQGSKDIKSNWVMHEYYLPDHWGRSFVICHVMLKPDDKAVSGPSFSLPHIEPHTQLNLLNGNDSTTCAMGSWSVSRPSISSRSERMDVMDFFNDSEPEHCNLSEDAIQMTMQSLLSSFWTTPNDGRNLNQVLARQLGASSCSSPGSVPMEPTFLNNCQSFIQHSFIDAGDSSPMEFSFLSDSQFDDSEGSEHDFLNDILIDNDEYPHGNGVQILGQFQGSENSSGQPAIIRENRQTQTMKSIHGVLPIDEAEGFVEVSSSATVASKVKGFRKNSLPVLPMKEGKLQDGFISHRKIKVESTSPGTEAFKAKSKEVKKHGSTTHQVKKIESVASSSAIKEGKNTGQVTKLNCKTELVPCSSCQGGVCYSSTPPICDLVNLIVGFILLMFFLSQVF